MTGGNPAAGSNSVPLNRLSSSSPRISSSCSRPALHSPRRLITARASAAGSVVSGKGLLSVWPMVLGANGSVASLKCATGEASSAARSSSAPALTPRPSNSSPRTPSGVGRQVGANAVEVRGQFHAAEPELAAAEPAAEGQVLSRIAIAIRVEHRLHPRRPRAARSRRTGWRRGTPPGRTRPGGCRGRRASGRSPRRPSHPAGFDSRCCRPPPRVLPSDPVSGSSPPSADSRSTSSSQFAWPAASTCRWTRGDSTSTRAIRSPRPSAVRQGTTILTRSTSSSLSAAAAALAATDSCSTSTQGCGK